MKITIQSSTQQTPALIPGTLSAFVTAPSGLFVINSEDVNVPCGKPQTQMRTLRLAAFVTIIGGLVAFARFAQALAIEVSFDGPHDLPVTIPLFLAVALIAVGLMACGLFFLRIPTRKSALWVARACAFSMSILLAGVSVGGGAIVLTVGLVYFFVLKPAVIREFGTEGARHQPLEPLVPSGRG